MKQCLEGCCASAVAALKNGHNIQRYLSAKYGKNNLDYNSSYFQFYLRVQREGVEAHRANESDVSSLGIKHVVVGGNPQTSVLGQHFHHLEGLEVINEDVWKPQLIDQLQVHRDHGIWRGCVQLLKKALGYMQAWFLP